MKRSRGSSPRVRGKLHRRGPVDEGVRLIPARAGKTAKRRPLRRRRRAHPRACGENRGHPFCASARAGSSPRVRGKHGGLDADLGPHRLIPARAGKTRRNWQGSCPRRAHPRACGENQDENIVNLSKDGSSPRVRGKRPGDQLTGDHRGLIPARAGKTLGGPHGGYRSAAHPRACGENWRGRGSGWS